MIYAPFLFRCILVQYINIPSHDISCTFFLDSELNMQVFILSKLFKHASSDIDEERTNEERSKEKESRNNQERESDVRVSVTPDVVPITPHVVTSSESEYQSIKPRDRSSNVYEVRTYIVDWDMFNTSLYQ